MIWNSHPPLFVLQVATSLFQTEIDAISFFKFWKVWGRGTFPIPIQQINNFSKEKKNMIMKSIHKWLLRFYFKFPDKITNFESALVKQSTPKATSNDI